MARLTISALESAGHAVDVVSELRSYFPDPTIAAYTPLKNAAEAERRRIALRWKAEGRPDLWFCYHPYYKAPDLLGPELARDFGLAYVTAEASYSFRRNQGLWAETQASVLSGIRQAAVNICLTGRDRDGIVKAAPDSTVAGLPPFLDPALFLQRAPQPEPGRLICVAMMRAGDKTDSYAMLARGLERLLSIPWTLSIVGDGPQRDAISALFSGIPSDRLQWHGEAAPDEVAELLSQSMLYVWPGCGEAYGLAYLEAQAAGLPVIAQSIAGVPEVVEQGVTGLLTPADDPDAYGAAIARLLANVHERQAMSVAARAFAGQERSLERAAARLSNILETHVSRPS